MQNIKYVYRLTVLVLLSFCSLVMGVDINITGDTILIPTPDGFTDVNSVAPDIFSNFENMCPTQNHLLAVFVTHSDAEMLLRGDDAILSEYIVVQSVKNFEGIKLSESQFRSFRNILRNEYDSLFQKQNKSGSHSATQTMASVSDRHNREVVFNINDIAPLGVDAETASSITLSQLANMNLSVSGSNSVHTVAVSMTAALLKRNLLYIYVFRLYRDQSDIEWTRLQSSKWLPTVVAANETDLPSTLEDIIPATIPISAVTNMLFSGAMLEYNMRNNPKAQGLNISIKYPDSWKAEEAIRPHIVQKFNGPSKSGISPSCMLTVQNIPLWGRLIFEGELGQKVLVDNFHEIAPSDAIYLCGNTTKLDGEPSAWMKFYCQSERAGVSIGIYSMHYFLFYDGKMITIQFSVGGLTDDKELLREAFETYLPTFQVMANSIVIHDKWAKADHFTFIEHLTGWSVAILFIIVPTILSFGFIIIRPKKNITPPPLPISKTIPPPLHQNDSIRKSSTIKDLQ